MRCKWHRFDCFVKHVKPIGKVSCYEYFKIPNVQVPALLQDSKI